MAMKKRSFVLLSGGIDSTTCLAIALDAHKDLAEEIEAVSVFYGQRHARELEYAKKTCEKFGIKHTILDVGDLLKGKHVLLSADSVGEMKMVDMSYDDIKGVSPSYVPFRNGLLLSAITAHAHKYVMEQINQEIPIVYARMVEQDEGLSEADAKEVVTQAARDLVSIYYGAHAEDAANWAYPDCTPEFNGAMANAIYTGSYYTIRLLTPLQWMKKHEIISKGSKLYPEGDLYADTWSCYDNGEYHCGTCPTCRARKEAFKLAGISDPTIYQEKAEV